MVQIKTGPDKTNKTTADLNENLQRLNTNIETLLKKREEAKAKADKDQEDKDKPKLLKELAKALKGNEASKQYGNGLNLAVAGLTGAAFPLVAKLNIDKMIGTTLKYAGNYIKKKWAESAAGKSSSSSKISSAVESNKQSGTHRRLDKITGLLQYIAHKPKEGEEGEKKQSFFGRVLTFLGSLLGGILNSGIVKIVGALAVLGGIKKLLEDLLNGLGIKTTKKDIGAVGASLSKGTIKAANQSGALLDKIKEENKIRNKLYSEELKWKKASEKAGLSPQEKANALKSENELNKIIKEKGLSAEDGAQLKEARARLKNTTFELNTKFTPEKAAEIGTSVDPNVKTPLLQRIGGWFKAKYKPGVVKTGLNTTSKIFGGLGKLDPALSTISYTLIAAGALEEYMKANYDEERKEALVAGLGTAAGMRMGAYTLGPLLTNLGLAGGVALAPFTGGLSIPILGALGAVLGYGGGGYIGGKGGDYLTRKAMRYINGIPTDMTATEYMNSLNQGKQESLNNILTSLSTNEYGINSDSQYILNEDNKRDLTNLTSNTNTTNRLLTSIDESLQTILNAIGYQFQNMDNPSNPYNKSRPSSNPSRDQTVDILTPNKPDTNALWSN